MIMLQTVTGSYFAEIRVTTVLCVTCMIPHALMLFFFLLVVVSALHLDGL